VSARIFDITPLVSERIGVFPGDVEFKRHRSLDFEQGHHLRLSSITTTLHLGAHADGPNHYSKEGIGIDERDLRLYMGDCLVIEALVPKGTRVGLKHLSEKWRGTKTWPASRVLVRTSSFPNPDQWNSDFNSFEPELIEHFAKGGVRLIGIDTPSIDPEDSKALESHQMVAKHDLAVLEGIVLEGVPEGLYTLVALPMKIEGADAAPVRAVLIEGTNRVELGI
jgi:arylformamidase